MTIFSFAFLSCLLNNIGHAQVNIKKIISLISSQKAYIVVPNSSAVHFDEYSQHLFS